MIYSGRMAIVSRDSQDKEVIVATLGPGEFFGEFSFLTDAPRSATVRASEDTVLFELSREKMRQIIQERPVVGEALQQYYKARVLDLALARLELFSGIPGKDRKRIIERFMAVGFDKGSTVMDSRNDAGDFFLLKTGTVTIRQEEAGLILDEQQLKAGDMFWYNNPNHSVGALVTATADLDCEIMRLRADHLAQSSGKVPALGKKLGEMMAASQESSLHVLRPVDAKPAEGEG
jgi:CRP-like cAMP-binding protein